jgi:hypothetical protein
VLEDLERAARLNGRSVEEEGVARLARGGFESASRHSGGVPTVADFRALRAEHPLPPLSLVAASRGQRRPVEELLAKIEVMQKRHPLPELTPELLDELKREGRA